MACALVRLTEPVGNGMADFVGTGIGRTLWGGTRRGARGRHVARDPAPRSSGNRPHLVEGAQPPGASGAAFDAAWAEGRAMTREQSVANALELDGASV
jgi:hypothetical protein